MYKQSDPIPGQLGGKCKRYLWAMPFLHCIDEIVKVNKLTPDF